MQVHTKLNPSDQVTNCDRDIERRLVGVFRREYPRYRVIGEESGAHEPVDGTSSGTAIIDPIDGTSNFVHGIPYFSISVLIRHGIGDPTAIIYDPVLDELFTNAPSPIAKTVAAWQATSAKKRQCDMSVALIAGYGADLETSQIILSAIWATGVKRVLTNWSPSLDYCRLAQGLVDVVVYSPKHVDLTDNAGRAFATSRGMTHAQITIGAKARTLELCLDYMPGLPAGFARALA